MGNSLNTVLDAPTPEAGLVVVLLLEHVALPHLPDVGLVLVPLRDLSNPLQLPGAGLAGPTGWFPWTSSSLGLKLSSSSEMTLSLDLAQVWSSTILPLSWNPSKASCSLTLFP